jgi:alpha-amylase
MASIVFYFHAHQPYRIKNYSLFSIGEDYDYFSESQIDRLDNQKILRKVASKCYLPMNNLLLSLLSDQPSFKVSFSLSGVFLDQLERYAPEVLSSFADLVKTGRVELLNETYYHSLSFVYSRSEFAEQVAKHQQRLFDLFGYKTTAFRNTELIYNNDVAKAVEELGFGTILAEGVDRYLGFRAPNYVYRPTGTDSIRLLLKNYTLSDDIAFRFSNRDWKEWPLSAPKYATWIGKAAENAQVINLFMDYETFGEHQWEDAGIFNFMRHLPSELLANPNLSFATVTEAAYMHEPCDFVDMPELTSWADIERDLSAWMSNSMQTTALSELYNLEYPVKQTGSRELLEDWRRLTTSDHFYYMCTKWFSDGDVHKYFSPNTSPYEAYNHFMTVLQDLKQRVRIDLER